MVKSLDWSILKAFADTNINTTEKLKSAWRMKRNIVGKGIFTFSNNVYKRRLSEGRQKLELCDWDLNFKDPMGEAFENIMGKGENAGIQHFLLSSTMFSTHAIFRDRNHHFNNI